MRGDGYPQVVVSVSLDCGAHDRITDAAKRGGISVSELVRRIVRSGYRISLSVVERETGRVVRDRFEFDDVVRVHDQEKIH